MLVKTTYLLLLLHLGAVAKHQILDKDAVFSHMAPGARPAWLPAGVRFIAATDT